MAHLHPSEKAKAFAQSAFQRIIQEGLVPTPENYELWFVYYSGANPALVRALDLAAQKSALNDLLCAELFHQFLSDSRADETVRQAGEQIKKTIEDVSGAVVSVNQNTREFSKNLETVTDQLQQDVTKEEITDIINHVISDTKEMVGQNERLEQLLGNSTKAIEDLKRDLEIARKEALTDGLTGLTNRKGFDSELQRFMEQSANESGFSFVLILMDIDHFKKFNDTFGHLVGDQVLKLVAKTLKDTLKGKDIIARYGGEEFAIILADTKVDVGLRVADMIRQEVSKKEVVNRTTGERIAKITLSAGIAEYTKGEAGEALIARSDAALYAAKNNGRNQVCAAQERTAKKA